MTLTFKEFKILSEEYEQLSGPLGSNEGGVYQHIKNDTQHYIKFPQNPQQAHVEVATSKLYNELGIKTLNPQVKQVGGKPGLITDWNPSLQVKSLSDIHALAQDRKHALALARMHHGAILTNNRDIIGLNYDNIAHNAHKDELVSMDQGGSMHFRAQGGDKPFGSNIDELESFKKPRYTVHHVFSKVFETHPDVEKEAAKSLKNLTDDKIDSIMKEHSLEEHAQTIKDRRDMLIKHYGV